MAKKNMQMRYKSKKRERNKIEVTKQDEAKSILKTIAMVLVFLGVMYLMMMGLEKIGVFEKGYSAPTHDTSLDYEYINIGTVFNRSDKTYYVLFDDYSTNISYNTYVDKVISTKLSDPVYKVDMGKEMNSKFKSEESNKDATNSNELKINGITLIKINNGRIDMYLTGNEEIEEYIER